MTLPELLADPGRPLKVRFVHVPKRRSYYRPFDEFLCINFMPMGVFSMAEILERAGHDVEIVHLGIELILDNEHGTRFDVGDYVAEEQPDLVAIPLHWHFQSYDAVEVARKVKRLRRPGRSPEAKRGGAELPSQGSSIPYSAASSASRTGARSVVRRSRAVPP